ncbi:MAG TPA: pyrimidine dimer DNA glycosylase/endonuclease V [Vicinamibacteria bacterium]|nr:pyrimidine dimer DNA glycosylase/endonuclease V [Vicinamibacteria bacterium]
MRLWTLHPRYLDARGLVALWREALLAQAVLRGRTRGYRHHPQLDRFRRHLQPLGSIAAYLRAVQVEAASRGYAFAAERISRASSEGAIAATRGQLEYEWEHLRAKLRDRDPGWLERLRSVARPRPHPLFRLVPGGPEDWERVQP